MFYTVPPPPHPNLQVKSMLQVNAPCYPVASCTHLPLLFVLLLLWLSQQQVKRPAVPEKGLREWVACKFRSSWQYERLECCEAKGISGFMDRQTEVGGRQGMISCFCADQIIFCIFFFLVFFLAAFKNDFFVYFSFLSLSLPFWNDLTH